MVERTAVYRFFNEAGALLYVGMSKAPSRRKWQHKRTAEWYSEIARQDVVWFDDVIPASVEEQRAILAECPLYNRMMPPWDHPATKRARLREAIAK